MKQQNHCPIPRRRVCLRMVWQKTYCLPLACRASAMITRIKDAKQPCQRADCQRAEANHCQNDIIFIKLKLFS